MRRRKTGNDGLFVIGLFLGAAFASNTYAATVNFKTDAFTDNTSNLQFASLAGGFVVTVSGWQAEFPTITTTIPNVWGPFPTTPVGGASIGRAIFGVFTENRLVQGGIGLSVEPTGSLIPTETDTGTALFQPLFDNNMRVGTGDEIQFAVFEYSESVSVSQIIVDTSNGTGDIWVAGGVGAVPDLTTDFLATLTNLGVTISLDNMSGAEFVHNLTGFDNVDFLLVGTTPRDNTYGPLPANGPSNFGILRMTTVVPIPAAVDDGPIEVIEGIAQIIPVGANDVGFTDPVTVTVTILPSKGAIGAISPTGPAAGMTITYTASIGMVGADSFDYEMTDGTPASDTATVTVDISPDTDGDSVPDGSDNCTLVSNASQCDSDADGYGNRCDGDMNNNGATNSQDYVLFRQELGTVMGDPYNKADINCNGVVNSQDYVLFRSLLGQPSGPSGLVP